MISGLLFLFFFKQKTAYEMRISDWSSDVCSSDLSDPRGQGRRLGMAHHTDDLGPVAGHARRLRGVDLLVQAAEAREAGGEEGGAGVDIATSGRRLWGGGRPLPILPVARPWGGGPPAEREGGRGGNLRP